MSNYKKAKRAHLTHDQAFKSYEKPDLIDLDKNCMFMFDGKVHTLPTVEQYPQSKLTWHSIKHMISCYKKQHGVDLSHVDLSGKNLPYHTLKAMKAKFDIIINAPVHDRINNLKFRCNMINQKVIHPKHHSGYLVLWQDIITESKLSIQAAAISSINGMKVSTQQDACYWDNEAGNFYSYPIFIEKGINPIPDDICLDYTDPRLPEMTKKLITEYEFPICVNNKTKIINYRTIQVNVKLYVYAVHYRCGNTDEYVGFDKQTVTIEDLDRIDIICRDRLNQDPLCDPDAIYLEQELSFDNPTTRLIAERQPKPIINCGLNDLLYSMIYGDHEVLKLPIGTYLPDYIRNSVCWYTEAYLNAFLK